MVTLYPLLVAYVFIVLATALVLLLRDRFAYRQERRVLDELFRLDAREITVESWQRVRYKDFPLRMYSEEPELRAVLQQLLLSFRAVTRLRQSDRG